MDIETVKDVMQAYKAGKTDGKHGKQSRFISSNEYYVGYKTGLTDRYQSKQIYRNTARKAFSRS